MINMTRNSGSDVGLRATRRRSLQSLVVIGAVLGGTIALEAWLILLRHTQASGQHLPAYAAVTAAFAFLVMLSVGSVLAWRLSDELERRYCFIAGYGAFMFNICAYTTWFELHAGGLVGRPDAFDLFCAAGAAYVLIYLGLKLRERFVA